MIDRSAATASISDQYRRWGVLSSLREGSLGFTRADRDEGDWRNMARSGIRGSKVGAGPGGETERGPGVGRVMVTFWCALGHSTRPVFAATADIPVTWDCQDCDRLGGLDPDNPPAPVVAGPFKTHLAYVRDRRSAAEAEAILDEALTKLRAVA